MQPILCSSAGDSHGAAVRMWPNLRARLGAASPRARLLIFVAASFALHGVTLGVFVPFATALPDSDAPSSPRTLNATLVRRESAAAPVQPMPRTATPEQTTDQGFEQPPDAQPAHAGVQGRSGQQGVPLPLADKWYPASELDVRAEPVEPVEFQYPSSTGLGLLTGRVRIALYIDEQGTVRKTEILQSEPERVFDEAALQGWREVRFSPALRGGIAVKSEKVVEVEFQPPLPLP